MARALEGFTGLEHVMEPVATLGGVRFVNDSKATNIDAAARSIESFDRVVAIVGGTLQRRGLRGPARAAASSTARAWSRSARRGRWCAQALADVVPVAEAESMPTRCGGRGIWRVPDGVVLLAPACSSFDMFVDYADRGRRVQGGSAAAAVVSRVKREGRADVEP